MQQSSGSNGEIETFWVDKASEDHPQENFFLPSNGRWSSKMLEKRTRPTHLHHRPTDSCFRPSVGTPSPPSSPSRDAVHAFSFSAVVPGKHECMHCRQRAFALGFSQLNLHLGIWVCEACDPKNFKPWRIWASQQRGFQLRKCERRWGSRQVGRLWEEEEEEEEEETQEERATTCWGFWERKREEYFVRSS